MILARWETHCQHNRALWEVKKSSGRTQTAPVLQRSPPKQFSCPATSTVLLSKPDCEAMKWTLCHMHVSSLKARKNANKLTNIYSLGQHVIICKNNPPRWHCTSWFSKGLGGPSAKGNDKQPNTGLGSPSKSLQLFFFPLPITSLSPTCFFLSHKSVQKILLPFWYQFGAIISP